MHFWWKVHFQVKFQEYYLILFRFYPTLLPLSIGWNIRSFLDLSGEWNGTIWISIQYYILSLLDGFPFLPLYLFGYNWIESGISSLNMENPPSKAKRMEFQVDPFSITDRSKKASRSIEIFFTVYVKAFWLTILIPAARAVLAPAAGIKMIGRNPLF